MIFDDMNIDEELNAAFEEAKKHTNIFTEFGINLEDLKKVDINKDSAISVLWDLKKVITMLSIIDKDLNMGWHAIENRENILNNAENGLSDIAGFFSGVSGIEAIIKIELELIEGLRKRLK